MNLIRKTEGPKAANTVTAQQYSNTLTRNGNF